MTTENQNYEPAPVQDIFTDEDVLNYQDASTGQRFLNFLVDAILIQYGLAFLTGYLFARIIFAIAPDSAANMFGPEHSEVGLFFGSYLIGIMNYLLYYTICEKAFRGYTLGKLITGTRAVRTDGQELTFKNALLRTLSRIVPFEAFSGFGGHPWHDTWTDTMVIRTR